MIDPQPGITRFPSLDEFLEDGTLTTWFQPIVDLGTGSTIAFEALTRAVGLPQFVDTGLIFEYATKKNRAIDLDLVCLDGAIRRGASLPDHTMLFVNTHPAVFRECQLWLSTIERSLESSGLDPRRLVLEITEQETIRDSGNLTKAIDTLQSKGVRFAFDDVGVAYSHLPSIDQIRPRFLKISQDFGTGFESDATRQKIIRSIVAMAREFDCDIVLEGIETQATANAARAMGLRYGQGYHFERPRPAEVWRQAG